MSEPAPRGFRYDPGLDPWERQPGETEKQYRAFAHFRDQGPGRRVIATARELYKTPALLRGSKLQPSTQIYHWSVDNDWFERARLFDVHNDRQSQAARLKEIEAMDRRHALEARLLQEKAMQRLRSLNPEEMTVTEVLRYFIDAAKMERTARGVAEEVRRVEHTGADGGEIEVKARTRIDPEYIGKYLAILAEAGQIPDLIPRIVRAEAGLPDDQAPPLGGLPAPTVIDVTTVETPEPKRPDIDPGNSREVEHDA